MVGGVPLSPPLGGGTVVPPVPVPVDMGTVVGTVVGAVVGTVVGAVVGTTCPVAGGNTVDVEWVTWLELGRVVVFWEGLGGSASMAAVGWKSGCSGSLVSQYPRLRVFTSETTQLALVRNIPCCAGSGWRVYQRLFKNSTGCDLLLA